MALIYEKTTPGYPKPCKDIWLKVNGRPAMKLSPEARDFLVKHNPQIRVITQE